MSIGKEARVAALERDVLPSGGRFPEQLRAVLTAVGPMQMELSDRANAATCRERLRGLEHLHRPFPLVSAIGGWNEDRFCASMAWDGAHPPEGRQTARELLRKATFIDGTLVLACDDESYDDDSGEFEWRPNYWSDALQADGYQIRMVITPADEDHGWQKGELWLTQCIDDKWITPDKADHDPYFPVHESGVLMEPCPIEHSGELSAAQHPRYRSPCVRSREGFERDAYDFCAFLSELMVKRYERALLLCGAST